MEPLNPDEIARYQRHILLPEVGGAGHPPVTQENIITIATGVREAAE